MRRAFVAVAALLAPAPALACAACAAAADANNRTFFIMTMVMSVLPLTLIGAGLWWIRRNARERLKGEFEERDSLPAATRPVGAAAGPVPQTPPDLARS